MSLMRVNAFFNSCHFSYLRNLSNYLAIDLSILFKSALVKIVAFLKPLFLFSIFLRKNMALVCLISLNLAGSC